VNATHVGPHARFARWMYRSGRPNRVAAAMNRIGAWVGAAGLARSRMVTLEVVGRRTGKVVSFPLVPADVDGQRYLVSMLGKDASWVANVHAASGRAVLRQGRRHSVVLEEVEPSRRAPILKAYLDRAPGARPHVAVDRGAPLAEFERVAGDHPVFRVRYL
jgi:deazaflavin-dependent oxidoreductase (nitroreductase family)